MADWLCIVHTSCNSSFLSGIPRGTLSATSSNKSICIDISFILLYFVCWQFIPEFYHGQGNCSFRPCARLARRFFFSQGKSMWIIEPCYFCTGNCCLTSIYVHTYSKILTSRSLSKYTSPVNLLLYSRLHNGSISCRKFDWY